MTINEKISYIAIQKVFCLQFPSHAPVSLLISFTASHSLCYLLKITDCGMRECICDCFNVSRYIKGGRKLHV